MRPPRWIAGVVAVLALGAGIASGALAAPGADPDPVEARTYELRFRPLADVAEVVGPLLSKDGSLTLQPRLKTLLVQDHVSVLDRIASLLRGFDLPPRTVDVTVSLFLGSDRRDQEVGRQSTAGGFSSEVRGIAETLADFTKWTSYEPLGSFSVAGAEGAPVTVNVSPEYRVSFEVESIQDPPGSVKFRRFSLMRVVRSVDGTERTEELYNLGVVLPAGRMRVVGAAKGPESRRALFLTLQAKPR